MIHLEKSLLEIIAKYDVLISEWTWFDQAMLGAGGGNGQNSIFVMAHNGLSYWTAHDVTQNGTGWCFATSFLCIQLDGFR